MAGHQLSTPKLSPDPASLDSEVHLWCAEPEAIVDAALLDQYDALLTPSERARNRRFVFERHRRQDLVTRALVRTTLSAYAPAVDPGDWRFELGPYGRPEIAAPAIRPILRFNLSHADGMVVCAITRDRELGVDVEDTGRAGSGVEIADRYFSPGEVRELRTWPAERRRERFFHYWTLKEAYIKARGLGLQLSLDRFTFLLPDWQHIDLGSDRIGIAFDPELDDDPLSWQFASWDLTARHRVALAIRRRGADLAVRVLHTIPTIRTIPTIPMTRERSVPPVRTAGAESHVGVD